MKYDYRLLLRYQHTGSISENSTVQSDVVNFGNDEAAQIHMIEIIPPMNGATVENVFIRPVIDSNEYPNVFLHSLARKVIFGDHRSLDPLANPCPKIGNSLSIQAIGGPGGVTGDFEVRVWGDYFNGDDALQQFFGGTAFNNVPTPQEEGSDPFRGKFMTVHHPVELKIANFSSLPGGGAKADKPNVMPVYIYNFNKNATTANEEYPFTSANVWRNQFPLYWNINTQKEALIIDRIGANVEANGKYVGIKVGNDYYPASNFYVAGNYNEIPLNPDTTTVESLNLLHRAVIVNNEIGEIFLKDNGTSVSALNALVGVKGRYIYLK